MVILSTDGILDNIADELTEGENVKSDTGDVDKNGGAGTMEGFAEKFPEGLIVPFVTGSAEGCGIPDGAAEISSDG